MKNKQPRRIDDFPKDYMASHVHVQKNPEAASQQTLNN